MTILQKEIINVFENKNDNFKKSLKKEFEIENIPVVVPEMKKRQSILINEILEEIKKEYTEFKNSELFSEIEQTLFTHINSSETSEEDAQ